MNLNYSCNFCNNQKYSTRNSFAKRIGANSHNYNIVQCKNCGLLSLHPIPTDKEIIGIYKNYAEKGNRIKTEKFRQEKIYPGKITKIFKYKTNLSKLLEIGAGNGGFVDVAIKHGFKNIVGIEMQSDQVALAKNLFDLELINKTFDEYYQSNKETFDIIHMHHVLEHLKDPYETLNKIHSILNINGILIFEVPNQFNVFPQELFIRIGLIKIPKPYNPLHHFYFFSSSDLTKALESIGFEILEVNDKMEYIQITPLRRFKLFISKVLNLSTSNTIEIICRRSTNAQS